jgi:endonuclease/exonuclease/phosphatase family metal-dependent hydrolase
MAARTALVVLSVLALSTLVAAGCAVARNYDQPLGPLIEYRNEPRPLEGTGASTPEVRVVTFNLKVGEHVSEAATLLAGDARTRGADVLVLQEMDAPGAEQLARALLMNHAYVPSAVHPSSDRDFGVAILSPWPITNPRKVPLPHQHRFRKLRRAAVAATIGGPRGDFRVYGLHLENPWGLSPGKRRAQARAVLADARDWTGPIVIAGDLNGRAPAEEIEKGGFSWFTRDVHDTIGPLDADHILARGFCDAGIVPSGKADRRTGVSDHAPVWSVLRYCGS